MFDTKLSMSIIRWTARISGVGIFLFWGAFFVDHVSEWIIAPSSESPPLKVWIALALHLAMLSGFIVALKWEVAGSGLIIFAAFAFFIITMGEPMVKFFLVTIIPALLYLFVTWRSKGDSRTTT
ncbi:MAG: hypothetical protein QGG85_00685 [Candidatus Marinimicrobia bacterium]|jgi:hypothetical protein|nr:hypothetical protein [Candidatus Neomarinimicrobiota bacterium]MDP6457544.1 hypothetical protein [Candidatus Neomarinimicrobiota bacterium]MDP6835707.1 hypothetical protein [Candidatus Neomarinimicrobiota bacterium]|tara:strand:- start:2718 stop:3089 length:372 start_codon:yes stop_codon:yes gene_type:complete